MIYTFEITMKRRTSEAIAVDMPPLGIFMYTSYLLLHYPYLYHLNHYDHLMYYELHTWEAQTRLPNVYW